MKRLRLSFTWQPAYWATVIGVAMVVTGFALLAFGWRGAAALLLVPLQAPFSVSGGLAGVALIGLGAALVNVQVSRHLAARERALTAIAAERATELLLAARARGE